MKTILLKTLITVFLFSSVTGIALADKGKPSKVTKKNIIQRANNISENSNKPFKGRPILPKNVNHGNGGGPKKIPIDGGLSLLLAAGVGLGARMLLANKKQETP